jgi:uncharacterized protein YkwD
VPRLPGRPDEHLDDPRVHWDDASDWRDAAPAVAWWRHGPIGVAVVIAGVLAAFGLAAVVLPPVFAGRPAAAPALAPAPGPGGDVARPTPSGSVEPLPTAAASASPSASRPATPAPVADPGAAFEDEVVALVNRERAKTRCAPLRNDERLRAAARVHSLDMAGGNFLRHTGRDGSSPQDRMRRTGYGAGLSENLARGQRTSGQVVEAWLNSREHRGNILDCRARAIGVGLALRGNTPYWTQNFGGE